MKILYYVLYAIWLFTVIMDIRYTIKVRLKNLCNVKVAIRSSWFTIIETFNLIALGYLQLFFGKNNMFIIIASIFSIICMKKDKECIESLEELEKEKEEEKQIK